MGIDTTQVAYHEAGHATMARLLGIEITSVAIARHGGSLGHVKHGDIAENSAEHIAMFLIAGYVAQRIHVGADSLEMGEGSLEDLASASSLLQSATPGDERDIETRLEVLDAEVEKRLRSRWDAVERVAMRLLEREMLSFVEVDECIAARGTI
jgi:hypothetical protein